MKKKTRRIIELHELIRIIYSIVFLLFNFSIVYGQDFGFGFNDEDSVSSSDFSVSIGGEAKIEFPFYFKEYNFDIEEIFGGKINLNLSYNYLELITSFNLSYASISEFWDKNADWGKANHTPLIIDEAFLRAYIGQVNIEAGFRKLTWGKADSSGPLDVTNPVDFTDLRYITDLKARKIARPMLRLTWDATSFSRLEGVFIPNFTPHKFAQSGRWTPSQVSNIPIIAGEGIFERAFQLFPSQAMILEPMYPFVAEQFSNFHIEFPDYSSLDNFQTGLRFTATVNSIDIGFQYFYGNLFRPSLTINGVDLFLNDLIIGNLSSPPPYFGNPALLSPNIKYTRYHQFGVDYAQVLYGFNTRAELALNLTEDFDGKDGSLQNPFIAWSLGFDRDIGLGINLNIQCNQTIRLFNSRIGDNPVFDCEAGTNMTNTRLTTQLSRNFLRDNLETKATLIWDIENIDCYLIPSVSYLFRDFIFDITAGFFMGDKSGELGQYYKNNFVRFGVTYKF